MLAVVLSTLVATVPGAGNAPDSALRRAGPEAAWAAVADQNPPNRAEPWTFPPPKDTDR